MIRPRKTGIWLTGIAAALCAFAAASPAGAQDAQPANTVALLQSAVAKAEGMSIIGTFPGPSGLTGVVMLVHDHKMVTFVTPDGQTWISGYLMNLKDGTNLTAAYASRYAGSGISGLPRPVIEQIIDATSPLTAVQYGQQARNVVTLVFNPSAPDSLQVLAKVLAAAQHAPAGLQYAFLPVGGQLAAWILSAPDNAGQISRIQALLQNTATNPTPSSITPAGTQAADQNSKATINLPVRAPFLTLNLPDMAIENVVQANGNQNSDQLGLGAVNAAGSTLSSMSQGQSYNP